jgi:hypothetical protein
MKRLKYFLPLFLLLAGCDSDDDGFYNTVYIQANNLVSVANPQTSYAVGDVVYVNAYVPNLLAEQGFDNPIDVRETTGNADQFDFSYMLEKLDASGEWELYTIDDVNYVPGGFGDAQLDPIVRGLLDFDADSQQYAYMGGVRITEPGQYRLNFTNTTRYAEKAFLRSLSPGNNVTMNLYSASSDMPGGLFAFTVN